jgi:Ca2+-binding RTX toxin-like protein
MWFNRKGQSTGEYALVFAIVLGAIVAMQTYVKRELQGRVKDGADYMATNTAGMGSTGQYEPYYYNSNYTTNRNSNVTTGYIDTQATESLTESSDRAGSTNYTAPQP